MSGGAPESALERLRRIEAERARQAMRPPEPPPPPPPPSCPDGDDRDAFPQAGRPSSSPSQGQAAKGVAVGVGVVALSKAGTILTALKAIKLGTFLTTFGTMAASIALYAGMYGGVKVAAPVVLLILIHELGHGAMMLLQGISPGAIVFVPFMGAYIGLGNTPRSSWQHALIALGGPLAGGLGGLACVGFGLAAEDPKLAGLAMVVGWITLTLNLLNLWPVGGLDGSKIVEPILFRDWVLGLISLVLLFLTMAPGERGSGMLVILLILGAWRAWVQWRHEHGGEPAEVRYRHEHEVEPWQRTAAALCYFGLAGALALASAYAEHHLARPQGG